MSIKHDGNGQAADPLPANGIHALPATLAEHLARFINPDEVTELRALHVTQRYGKPATVAGFYDGRHLADMAAEALQLTDLAAASISP